MRITPPRIARSMAGIAAGLALVVGLSGCASGDTADTGDQGSDQEVMFLSTQPAGDSGSIDDMIAGLDELEATGVSTRYLEVTDPSSFESSLRNAA